MTDRPFGATHPVFDPMDRHDDVAGEAEREAFDRETDRSEAKCYGGLHALDCQHIRLIADAAVAALTPRLEAVEAAVARCPGRHWHYTHGRPQMSNANERYPFND